MQNRIGLKIVSQFHLQMPCFHLQVAARHLQPVPTTDAKAASGFFYRCFGNYPAFRRLVLLRVHIETKKKNKRKKISEMLSSLVYIL